MKRRHPQKHFSRRCIVPATRLKPSLDDYPFFKVFLTFTLAPAIVGLFIMLIFMFSGNPAAAILFGFIAMLYAQSMYCIPALVVGIIISACRWGKNWADIYKATAVGGLCAGIPTVFHTSTSLALSATLVASVTCMLLAYLVLPADEDGDIPVYEPEEPDYWAVEIPASMVKTTTHARGVYYLKDLPTHALIKRKPQD
ncbi:hypothetical protein LVJ82_11945 [Vitreoscilla massiliensis]|uniref:Uncharacterized protein n=1 Tax=Vitreoscilla massiliensis TaxID=1689272 RepID=A0ABY4E446_9NEIS|nr:hypothetical protein [Vitreoscilla massiliensis]UOO88197.1 hypothetical protein LVJ82_11945 [Vitreoscilla massiliensis]